MSYTIKVSNSSDPVKVGSAIAHAIYEGNEPEVRAIGVAAVNQAVKGLVNARGYAAQRGHNLYMIPAFDTIETDAGEELSVIVIRVIDIRSPVDWSRAPEEV